MSTSLRRPYTYGDTSPEIQKPEENKNVGYKEDENPTEELKQDHVPRKLQIERIYTICSFSALIISLAFLLLLLIFIFVPSTYPDLLDAELEDLVKGLEKGAWTSVDLTKAYLLRIEETNSLLHAVTEVNPDALSIAAALDEERASGTIRSPLHGIPMLIKNNIATKDKLNNTAGSYLLLGATVPRDATVVTKLRAAGVIILGKSNLSQWAYFRSSNSFSRWSAHGGQVLGAYHTKQDPCGSSSGSGVGSSIGLAWASLGSETDGSIVCPAERNNIVGIKPTVGLTSRSLVIPISEHQDTIGPMARTVSDAAHILSVISGKDELDNYTLAQPWDVPPNYALALNISSLKGARIGVPRNALLTGNISQPVMDAFEVAVQVLKDAGATVIENANLDAWEEFEADYRNPFGNHSMILHVDFFSNLPGYLSQLTSSPYKIEGLAGLRELTQNSPSEAYPQRNTAIWDKSLAYGLHNSDIRFWQAYQHVSYLGGEGGVPGALARHSLDALILPSDLSSGIAAGAGLPLISSPMGFYPGRSPVTKSKFWGLVESGPGIPFGLSFMGGKWSEEKLIGIAYAFEQRTNFRKKKKPLFLPKTQLRDVVKT